jgi:hypothetical protein
MNTLIQASVYQTALALVAGTVMAGAQEEMGPAANPTRDSVTGGNPVRGAVLFQQEVPRVHGNGRTCATCHVPDEAFQLTPSNVGVLR